MAIHSGRLLDLLSYRVSERTNIALCLQTSTLGVYLDNSGRLPDLRGRRVLEYTKMGLFRQTSPVVGYMGNFDRLPPAPAQSSAQSSAFFRASARQGSLANPRTAASRDRSSPAVVGCCRVRGRPRLPSPARGSSPKSHNPECRISRIILAFWQSTRNRPLCAPMAC